jgi:hypothetical protein
MSVWEVTRQAGEAVQKDGDTLRQAVFEDGVILEGKHITNTLFLDADGIIVNQQRSKNKKAEVRLLTGYDGKQITRTGRCALKHRYSVAATRDADSFWEESNAHLANQWNISKIERVELGGDGADWIKQGSELFPNTVYHLDRYHLRQRLTEALASDPACHQATVTAIEHKDRQALADILDRYAKANRGKKRKQVNQLKRYLLDNWDGIIAEMPEDGLGVIEGQVRHIIARRMKRIGARWSPEGTDRMARLLAAKSNEELNSYLTAPRSMKVISLAKAAGESYMDRRVYSVEDTQAWLQAHVPALSSNSKPV